MSLPRPLAAATLVFLLTIGPRAFAGDEASARSAFQEGTRLVENANWAEALAAFERADALSPHPVTTYNIAACEKAMGRYTRAKRAFARAIAENDQASGKLLPQSLVAEARGYLAQIDKLLVHVAVTLRPANATIVVDGRPLVVEPEGGTLRLVAGILPPGPGEVPPSAAFTLELDPGAHVFTFARKGFSDAVINRTFEAGRSYPLDLSLDELPTTLHVASDRPGALVFVNGADLGPVPRDILRPAGDYRVVVKKDGFVSYDTLVALRAGEETALRATLPAERIPVTKRWWFWTAAAVVVSGAAMATYFATRPEPRREEVDGGTLGWKVAVP